MDYNDENQIEQLRKDARDPGGRRLIEYFKSGLPEYDGIDDDLPDEEVGKLFKRVKDIRTFVHKKTDFITSK